MAGSMPLRSLKSDGPFWPAVSDDAGKTGIRQSAPTSAAASVALLAPFPASPMITISALGYMPRIRRATASKLPQPKAAIGVQPVRSATDFTVAMPSPIPKVRPAPSPSGKSSGAQKEPPFLPPARADLRPSSSIISTLVTAVTPLPVRTSPSRTLPCRGASPTLGW